MKDEEMGGRFPFVAMGKGYAGAYATEAEARLVCQQNEGGNVYWLIEHARAELAALRAERDGLIVEHKFVVSQMAYYRDSRRKLVEAAVRETWRDASMGPRQLTDYHARAIADRVLAAHDAEKGARE